MTFSIFETTPENMYDVFNSENINIKKGKELDFINLEISDYAEPGDDFTITLSDKENFLTYEKKLYIIVDEFRRGSAPKVACYSITPFFVNTSRREFGTIVYDCTKIYKSYLIANGSYEGVLL